MDPSHVDIQAARMLPVRPTVNLVCNHYLVSIRLVSVGIPMTTGECV